MKITDPVQLFTLGFTEEDFPKDRITSRIFEDWVMQSPITWSEVERKWVCDLTTNAFDISIRSYIEITMERKFLIGKKYLAARIEKSDYVETEDTGPR